MYILDGVAHANDLPLLAVTEITALDGHKMRVRFNTGAVKTFDLKPWLIKPAFAALADEALFKAVTLEYGVPVWLDGEVDIAPEVLLAEGV